ncbi:MAG: class I SAM-dependent methyltransferase [Pseudomonadota bacterium]|nr:class I SAM-dependent methyltransferase [Pseudomonadota bacterium]
MIEPTAVAVESEARLKPPARVTLQPGREKSVAQRHPWVFDGSIATVEGTPAPGDTVMLHSTDGAALASAAWSPHSKIRARIWSFDSRETIDAAFFSARVETAVRARDALQDSAHDACRLVHGESDGVPGLVADRYRDVVVVQILSAGAERWREPVIDALAAATGCAAIYERSNVDVRALEGLPPREGPVRGSSPATVEIVEDGLRYAVDIAHGQKTGFYLDQRANRARVRALASQREVLNCFCYTGGFTVAALAGGAKSVLSIDSSADAIALGRRNVATNGFDPARSEWRDADVFVELRKLRDAARSFDLIVLDPPKFAPTPQHAEKATRAYKDINLLALKLLRPGGLLATFSCSGGISADLFQKIVAGAALDGRANAVIVERFAAFADHPVALHFPQGDYLKGLLVRKVA